MNGFEPPADYGASTASQNGNLPFIPPPDYSKTIKYVKQSKGMNGQAIVVPRPPPRHRPGINPMTNGDASRTSLEPTELPQDQQKSDPKERILKMLRNQGVPVFPGLSKPESVDKSEPTIAPPQNLFPAVPQNLGPTKAYLKHLENHRNFDTLHSFRGMDNCPICKEMQEEIELLAQTRQRKDHRSANGHSSHDSLITTGKAFRPLDAVVEDELEPEEDANEITTPSTYTTHTKDYFAQSSSTSKNERSTHVKENGTDLALTARPVSDWKAESSSHLSVKFSETLKVLEMGINWWRCENSQGDVGWVPAKQLYLMPTGYY